VASSRPTPKPFLDAFDERGPRLRYFFIAPRRAAWFMLRARHRDLQRRLINGWNRGERLWLKRVFGM
jgi:hypothetical protein